MKRFLIRVGLPLGVTAIMGVLFFRHISISDIGRSLNRLPASAVLGFISLSLVGTLLRAVKYRVLISNRLGLGEMILITLVRNFSVDLLPARTASLAFYTALTRRRGLSIEEGTASFAVSVFYDVLALSLMLGGLLVFFPPSARGKGFIFAGMGVLLLVSSVLIMASPPIFHLMKDWRLVQNRPRLRESVTRLSHYLEAHAGNRERLHILGLSLAIRLVKYASVFWLFCALVPIERSPAGFSQFSLGLAGTELSAVLPIQGAGGFGTWEMAFELVFRGIGVSGTDLRLTALVIHITTQAWEYAIGLLAFLALWIAGKRRRTSDPDQGEGNS